MGDPADEKIAVINRMAIVVTLVFGAYAAGFLRNKLPPQIPLFYSKPWGEEQLATPIHLAVPFILIILCGGLFLAARRGIGDRILKRLVLGGIVAIEVLILLAVIRIILLIS